MGETSSSIAWAAGHSRETIMQTAIIRVVNCLNLFFISLLLFCTFGVWFIRNAVIIALLPTLWLKATIFRCTPPSSLRQISCNDRISDFYYNINSMECQHCSMLFYVDFCPARGSASPVGARANKIRIFRLTIPSRSYNMTATVQCGRYPVSIHLGGVFLCPSP